MFLNDIIVFYSDYKTGFGGEYGVQSDRVDKSAVGWEHHENLNKHQSQTDYSKGQKLDIIKLIVEYLKSTLYRIWRQIWSRIGST